MKINLNVETTAQGNLLRWTIQPAPPAGLVGILRAVWRGGWETIGTANANASYLDTNPPEKCSYRVVAHNPTVYSDEEIPQEPDGDLILWLQLEDADKRQVPAQR